MSIPELGSNRLVVNGNTLFVPISFMGIMDSIFVPCTDIRNTTYCLHALARRNGYVLRIVERIEAGYLGVRAWRIA